MKKLMMIVASLLIATSLFSCVADSQSESALSPNASNASSTAAGDSSDTYKTGDKIQIDSSVGEYSVTIDGALESTNRNELADNQPKRIIIVNYSYENISCSQDITVSYLYFHVYDSSGNLLETYPSVDAKPPTHTISAGKKNSASVAYGLNNDDKQITLELYDITNPVNRIATYTLSTK